MLTQQTRDSVPLFAQCWSIGCAAGPTLSKQWLTVSCLLAVHSIITIITALDQLLVTTIPAVCEEQPQHKLEKL